AFCACPSACRAGSWVTAPIFALADPAVWSTAALSLSVSPIRYSLRFLTNPTHQAAPARPDNPLGCFFVLTGGRVFSASATGIDAPCGRSGPGVRGGDCRGPTPLGSVARQWLRGRAVGHSPGRGRPRGPSGSHPRWWAGRRLPEP